MLRQSTNTAKMHGAQHVALEIHRKLAPHIGAVRNQFIEIFRAVDDRADAEVYQAAPGEERATWWRAQLIRTANVVDFYTNLQDGAWWTHLRLTVLGQTMRYVVAVQKVGRGETGILAVTAFAEAVGPQAEGEDPRFAQLLHPGPDDSVTLLYSDSAEARWADVVELVDRTLAAAIASFSHGLG